MSAYQTTYAETRGIGLPGQIANSENNNVISRTVESAAGIAFGQPAFRGSADNTVKVYAAPTAVAGAIVGTGDGLITAVSADVSAPAGNYTVTMTGGTKSATLGALVGTGNGVMALANPAFAAGAKLGVWKVLCLEEGTDVGTFAIIDPDGVDQGRIAVGGTYDGDIKIGSLADGSADFLAGSYFPITVAAVVPSNGLGTFSVTKPDGTVDGTGTIGTAYNGLVNFTVADGANNFIVGDHFPIVVVQPDFVGLAKLNPSVPPSATTPDAYPQYFTGAFMTEGPMYVTAGDTVNDGDPVYWNPTTGRYTATATHFRIPGAKFDTSGGNGDIVMIALNLR